MVPSSSSMHAPHTSVEVIDFFSGTVALSMSVLRSVFEPPLASNSPSEYACASGYLYGTGEWICSTSY